MEQIFILPGFSPANKAWADDCQKYIPNTKAFYWQHWQTKDLASDWIEQESQKIIAQIGSQKVNLLAKSIGTAVAGNIVSQIPDSIHQLVLCGIPLNDLKVGDEKYYIFLKTFPAYKILCLQNEFDPHGKHSDVLKLFQSINPDLNVTLKTRPDHDYPYFEEFINFFT